MALASYFSKDALALSQVLEKATNEEFESILNSHIVEIAFDNSVKEWEAGVSLDLAIRLLSRLYPKIKISDLTDENQEIVKNSLKKHWQSIRILKSHKEHLQYCWLSEPLH